MLKNVTKMGKHNISFIQLNISQRYMNLHVELALKNDKFINSH